MRYEDVFPLDSFVTHLAASSRLDGGIPPTSCQIEGMQNNHNNQWWTRLLPCKHAILDADGPSASLAVHVKPPAEAIAPPSPFLAALRPPATCISAVKHSFPRDSYSYTSSLRLLVQNEECSRIQETIQNPMT